MTVPFNPQAFDAILMGDESLTIACGYMMGACGHRLSAVITRDATVRGWAEAKGLSEFDEAKALLGAGLAAEGGADTESVAVPAAAPEDTGRSGGGARGIYPGA